MWHRLTPNVAWRTWALCKVGAVMSRSSEPSWAVRVAAALEDAMRTRRVREVETAEWVWLEIELHDERWPLTIDILGSKHPAPSHIVYMLPGGGANFRATFLSP